MIIWIASYPKSGNTWVRSFISAILNNNEGNFTFKDLINIPQYPIRHHFEGFLSDFSDVSNIKKNWIATQTKLNLDEKIKFLKTHHVNCKIGNDSFTNFDNTLGVIYVVRDPRNVLTSLINHYSLNNQSEAKAFLLEEKNWLGFKKEDNKIKLTRFPTLISSWKTNYNSWKNTSKNLLIIKYEDLVSNPEYEFDKITNYLEKVLKKNIDKNKVNNALVSTSFEALKNREAEEGFIEGAKDKVGEGNKKFFNLGPENKWENLVNKNITNEIEKRFEVEMKELGYL
tara:strand:+ start:4890 stop:5741 length:852 start_codon:yes stop_codon:yes gene_type:complete